MRLHAALLALALALAPTGAALAQAANDPVPAEAGLLERFNRSVLQMNRTGGEAIGRFMDSMAPGIGDGLLMKGAATALFNAVNEPISIVSHLVAGDLDQAWLHTRRLAINTTAGFGGVVDRAAEWGLRGSLADLGLALCRRGVPDGPFVMVPVLGPRTTRDAVADVVIGNLVVTALVTAASGGSLSLVTLAIIAVLDEAAVLALARQMDPEAAALSSIEDYDALRQAYLDRRTERCASPG